jgi:hypothetical protein
MLTGTVRAYAFGAIVVTVVSLSQPCTAGRVPPPLPGAVIHFDYVTDARDGRILVDAAKRCGARVISLVPPAHVWDRPDALAILDEVVAFIRSRGLKLVISRVDASYPPSPDGTRFNYLYGNILDEPGHLPSGNLTVSYFLSTINVPGYAAWMEDETRFYAKRYGRLPNLIGFGVGPFNETFVSQRGGFLQWDDTTHVYEFTQYTSPMLELWHAWLMNTHHSISGVNTAYGTSFKNVNDVPMPSNGSDPRFAKADLAYFDLIRSASDWLMKEYDTCRQIWHDTSRRKKVPFMLQFSGFDAEKFMLGRPEFVAFDLADWINRADAVGVSLYTNGGYTDFGHSSLRSMTRFLYLARDLKKPVYVLEFGCENPYPYVSAAEWNFAFGVSLPLQPRTFIYEFLKDPFYATAPIDSGRLITADDRLRTAVAEPLHDLLQKIRQTHPTNEEPVLYVVADASKARGRPEVQRAYRAAWRLASEMPVHWVMPERRVATDPTIPMWQPAGDSPAEITKILEDPAAQSDPAWIDKARAVLEKARSDKAPPQKENEGD